LAVLRVSFPAFVPRLDVIGFHVVDFKMLLAFDAYAFLAFVGLAISMVASTACFAAARVTPKPSRAPGKTSGSS